MEKLSNDNKSQKQKGIGVYKSGTTQGTTIVKEIVPYPPQGADQPVEEDRWIDFRPTMNKEENLKCNMICLLIRLMRI